LFRELFEEEPTMTLLSIAPDIVAGASDDLANLGSALRSANAAAATQTTSIAAPAADEVSTAITALLGSHAQGFQALSAKAAAFHDDFVNLLSSGVKQYVSTEAANVQQTLANTVNAADQALLGHPLIGAGQGIAGGAAANAITGKLGPFRYSVSVTTAGTNATVTLHTLFGGPSLSLSETPTSSGGDFNATGTLNTLFGPVKWLTANGSAITAPDGTFSASLNEHTLFGPPVSLSLNATPVTSGGEVGEIGNATGTLSTPFGPVQWLTANASAITAPDGTFTGSINEHTLFSPPVSLSLNATPVTSGGEIGEIGNATGTLSTPFGPVKWLTANASAITAPDGTFSGSINEHTLIGHGGVSVTGTTAGGTLQITGGSLDVSGFTFSF
jgi:hypothetical protein